MAKGLRVTVVGWVGGKRIPFEVPDAIYIRLQEFKRRLGLTNDELVSRITKGKSRRPTKQQIVRFLDRQTE